MLGKDRTQHELMEDLLRSSDCDCEVHGHCAIYTIIHFNRKCNEKKSARSVNVVYLSAVLAYLFNAAVAVRRSTAPKSSLARDTDIVQLYGDRGHSKLPAGIGETRFQVPLQQLYTDIPQLIVYTLFLKVPTCKCSCWFYYFLFYVYKRSNQRDLLARVGGVLTESRRKLKMHFLTASGNTIKPSLIAGFIAD